MEKKTEELQIYGRQADRFENVFKIYKSYMIKQRAMIQRKESRQALKKNNTPTPVRLRLTTGPCWKTPAGGYQEEQEPCWETVMDHSGDQLMWAQAEEKDGGHADRVVLSWLISISEEAAGRSAATGRMVDNGVTGPGEKSLASERMTREGLGGWKE